ncbi:MAG: NrfD/PsrC family molybdoenzyme membrane anchor subunit, partial [Chloroflexota bacterium]
MTPDILEIINNDAGIYWGPVVAQYFFFTGISAAAFLISSLTYVFGQKRYEPIAGLALIVAFTVLLAAPLNLIADLAQPGRFYTLLYRTHITSPMTWGVFLLTAYPLLILLESAFAFRARFARKAQSSAGVARRLYTLAALGNPQITPQTEKRDHAMSRRLGIIGIPMALAVHGYTGFILWFAAGRPLWNTPVMPVVFLVSAVVSGLGLMILLTWLMVPGEDGKPRWSLMDGLAV